MLHELMPWSAARLKKIYVSDLSMSRLAYVLVFVCGVSCTFFSSYVFEYLIHQPDQATLSTRSYLPLDNDLYLHGDFLNEELKPVTDLAPKDAGALVDSGDAEHEARNSLQAAAYMCRIGRLDKAGKLFEHALALNPRHPDVLTEYGEFLEQSDVTRANQMYTRALLLAPDHRRALLNRRRTQPLVEQRDLDLLRRIDAKRRELAAVSPDSGAMRRVKKEAYFQQIHHTVGIEGNTLTLAETRHVVETRMAVGGRSVLEHNEVLGLDAAIKFVNTTLVHRIGDITLDDLLQIHRRVMGHVDPLTAGMLRTTQVYVSEHVPPPPARLHHLLEALVEWLNAPETLALHPVKYAALAHYKLVFIHPFDDGNGRTSRLLMNLVLMQAGFPPVIVRKQDRHVYYRCLRLANEGDVRPFVRFIAQCAEKTLDVYLWATDEHVQRIAASEAERAAAARAHDDELAFVRNFSGDDLVGFGAAEVIDVGEPELSRHGEEQDDEDIQADGYRTLREQRAEDVADWPDGEVPWESQRRRVADVAARSQKDAVLGADVTQPGDTVTPASHSERVLGADVTQPGDTVTPASHSERVLGADVTQPGDTVTPASHSERVLGADVTQPGDTVTPASHSERVLGADVTQPGDTVTPASHSERVLGADVTQPGDTVTPASHSERVLGADETQPGDTVTPASHSERVLGADVTQPGDTVTPASHSERVLRESPAPEVAAEVHR